MITSTGKGPVGAERRKAALKLMRKLLKKQGYAPNKVVTDKLPSYTTERNA